MFESEKKPRGFSLELLVLQLFAIPLFCAWSTPLFDMLAPGGSSPRTLAQDLTGYAFFAGVGLVYGIVMQIVFPAAAQSGGRWVWVFPAALLIWGLVSDWRAHRPYLFAGWFAQSFNRAGGDAGEGWSWMLTLWTVSCIFYSASVALVARRLRKARPQAAII
jgi:hypothetical protein